ncbi:MAG: thioredoxin [Flavobacteriales bacterium]|nr:thioredoxin [Flavobacteriales bacterium]
MFWKKKNRAPKPKAMEITEANFKEIVAQNDHAVLIDFWASWCAPCRVMGPIIDELSAEYEGKVIIGKVNTEVSPRLSQVFQIRSIPSLLIFDKGQLVERYAGVVPKPNLEEILDGYVRP